VLEVLSLGVKQPGCEVDHSLLSSAVVKNEWLCTSAPLYAFVTCTGTILTFYFYHPYNILLYGNMTELIVEIPALFLVKIQVFWGVMPFHWASTCDIGPDLGRLESSAALL
jgi:hypothetical protein